MNFFKLLQEISVGFRDELFQANLQQTNFACAKHNVPRVISDVNLVRAVDRILQRSGYRI